MLTRLPAPRTLDPLTAPVLRWGVMGPGWIAQRFVEAVRKNTIQQVVAVGSRSAQRADEFARRMGVEAAHGSYESLLADRQVDIVYVSTPHPQHYRCALEAIAAEKHVLVEKPLGINAIQAREVFTAAQNAGVFAGEAMWTRFLPKFDVLGQILADGLLGEMHTVAADHGEFFTTDHRIYDPGLAGGPMLDLGTYPIAFAYWTLGHVATVSAIGQGANDQINGQISATLGHVGGSQSLVHTTILSNTPTTAFVAGEDAYLDLPGPFYQPGPFRIVPRTGDVLVHDEEPGTHTDGLHFSAVDAARRIAAGAVDSEIHPAADVIGTLDVMDRIRAQVGIAFPGE